MANQLAKPSTTYSANWFKELALKRAQTMMGCYRLGDVGDPQVYAAAVVAVLVRYPTDVIMSVTEPATGIPSKVKWLPTIAEIVEACEEAVAPLLRQQERDRIANQTRKALPKPHRLSEKELDAQFERLGMKHLRVSKFNPPDTSNGPF